MLNDVKENLFNINEKIRNLSQKIEIVRKIQMEILDLKHTKSETKHS